MGTGCQETPCEIRNICGELQKIGCGNDASWLAVLLFVRNLLRQFTIFDDSRKKSLQEYVFSELARRDPSEAHLQRLLRGVELFLTDHLPMVAMREQLASEQAASESLARSITDFLEETLSSEQERSKLVGRFGRETMDTLAGGEDPAVMIPRLRQLITSMLVHYREEAQAWERKAQQLERIIQVDPLLAPLHNRRSLEEHLRASIARAKATDAPLSAMMIDVDNFKTAINDVYGHVVGDDVLRTLAKIIDAHAGRHGWFAARFGGDELVLVCDIDGSQAQFHADAIRLAVQHYEFLPRIDGRLADEPIRFTVSIGVAELTPGMDAEAFLGAADAAMYQVKHSGRNNVAQFEAPRA
ncbi:GGDEF domain-containing protein [Desulfovibrio sp. TomC]|uniref:GGDEF domain-containing protein n=1 Tax=Desulfovibrio sp. TomC TaxID=1562888 RepID=UPI00057524FF|nr:GGDEF domain-containing protein [Desulfovibrio sp. TomC]KHK01007.1 Diguanylate cyclase/phosphodiesterase domain 1 (GGDEF) [Desulfovibrio sp. TomC]